MQQRRRVRSFAITALAVASVGCASTPLPSSVPAVPSATAATETVVLPTPVPVPSSSAEVVVTPDLEPPGPLCPGPAVPAPEPNVSVRIGDGAPVPATMGSSTTQTCTTTGVADVGELDYPAPLVGDAGDDLTFAVDGDWHIRWIQVFDRDKREESGDTTREGPVAEGPPEVTIPIPARTGNSIVGMTMWVVSDDGRTVAQLNPSTWVRVED